MSEKSQALGAPVDLVLGPTPPADPRRALPYTAIRYVLGYPESYLQEYAQVYAAEQVSAERERMCAAIKAADDKASESDYMLDSDDCISVIRGTWNPGA